jgi:tetratricopeptide (TPR) repeat protein
MFFHELREHLVLASELIFQEGDPPVLAVGGSSRAGLECGSGVLEELLLPAVEHRGANAVLVTEIRDRGAFQQVKSKNGDLFLGSEALPGFLGHGETSARNCTLFERAFCPISTEARHRLDAKLAKAYSNRGIVWKAKKEYDKAIADYNEAIRLDPKDAGAYANRGNTWNAKKEYDKAIADYNEAIRLDPNYALAYMNRGNAWRDKKEYDKAIADYNVATPLDPTCGLPYINRGYTWSVKKKYDKAIADYNEAIRLDPTCGRAYNDLGACPRIRLSLT